MGVHRDKGQTKLGLGETRARVGYKLVSYKIRSRPNEGLINLCRFNS